MLNQYREIWFVDFEFIANGGNRPSVVCLSASELRSGQQISLWRDELGTEPPFDISASSLFVAYFASAELGCFRSLGWKQPARILDLFCEFKNEVNGLYPKPKSGLLGALSYYGLDSIAAAEKESLRDLIMNGGSWTLEERAAIQEYRKSDTDSLRQLLPRMLPKIDLPRALFRGRYMSAVSAMEFTGIPIDVELLSLLRDRWEELKEALISEVDREYGVYEGTAFKQDRFERWVADHHPNWPRHDSGKLKLDDDTFSDMSKVCPAVVNLDNLRNSLAELRLNKLEVGDDGFNRTLLSPFQSLTGRNQPGSTRFIFGPAKWLRSLIKPKEGYGVAYLNFGQQEFAIAAALSGDQRMMDAYRSGDPYLAFAKQVKAIPPGGTKATHPVERGLFKQCVLAVQYGMAEGSLAAKIGVSKFEAKKLLQLHRQVYTTFWKWSDNQLDLTIISGQQQTAFGWTHKTSYRADLPPAGFNSRTLVNFPMQANGAEMMRIAACLATEAGIEVCAPVHDAFMIQAPLDRLEADVARMQAFMIEASAIVLAGFEVRAECEDRPGSRKSAVVRYPNRYNDEAGIEFFDKVRGLLGRATSLKCPTNEPGSIVARLPALDAQVLV